MAHVVLVNAPSLYWATTLGIPGEKSYSELIIRANGGIEGCRFYPLEYLGFLSIKAYCQSQGLEVDYINGISLRHRSIEETFQAILESAKISGAPSMIGFTGANLVFEENERLATLCKEAWPDVKIVLGHDFASLNYERILRDHPIFDFIVRGEGEHAFHKLAQHLLEKSVPLSEVPGLIWIDRDSSGLGLTRGPSGSLKVNPSSTCELDSLPEVARVELRDLIARGHCGSVFTSRGCPFRCTFCTTGQISALSPGKTGYRLRSIDLVLNEVERLYKDFGLRTLNIVDDLFFTKSDFSKGRVEAFARGLIDRGLKLEFMFDCRVDSIDLELFKLLREAGLKEIFVGVETGNEAQRARYNKKFAAEIDPADTLNKVTEMGIRVVPGIITYHPDVTVPELKDTLNLLEKLGPQRFSVFLNKMKPYPGTPVYKDYQAKGLLNKEWPVPDYEFKDPEIERIYKEMLAITAREGTTRQMVENRMRTLLEEKPFAAS